MELFRMSSGGRGLPPSKLAGVAAAILMVAGLLVASVASAGDLPPECATSGVSLGEARSAYGDQCELPRIDCDEIDGLWYCSSRVIGAAAPGGVKASDVGSSDIGGTVVVTTTTTTEGPTTTDGPTTTASPPSSESTTTTTGSGQECGVVAIESESLMLVGDWRKVEDPKASGGSYITWEGLSPSANNGSPDDVISTSVEIKRAGSYRFTWSMRQPDEVDSDKANDSWLNFPDASRFGPSAGGQYSGFIKVYGNAKGDFAYSATADVNHNKSAIAIDFDSPGIYTMQIAGRSHGHQIDRIVIHHSSISHADAVSGAAAECGGGGTTTTTAPVSTSTTTAPATTTSTTEPGNPTCTANTSGSANLSKDLISLHYDHAPDRDDTHATAAGKEVATRTGFAPWVIGGAYGADNANSYQDETEPVMDEVWGANNWVNADDDWNGAVQQTADRWQETLDDCGDIWIAEGGQSDLSADVVRELKRRAPSLDTKSRVHLVQHSNWNEEKALDADLAYVKANTDYIRIADGNGGGNGTADFNDQNYNGPFVRTALEGPNGSGWGAAFDYYSPQNERLDFSDTVELMRILDIGTDEVNDIEDFADRFMR